MLPTISGEFAVVQEPEIRFNASGNAWAKIRGKAQDRAYNPDTKDWEPKGDPLFLDIIVGGKTSENLVESVTVGDSIVVSGKLTQRDWTDTEGTHRFALQLRADSIGVTVKYGPAKTPRMLESGAGPRTIPTDAGDPSDAPF